jgi:hypothetical protein
MKFNPYFIWGVLIGGIISLVMILIFTLFLFY